MEYDKSRGFHQKRFNKDFSRDVRPGPGSGPGPGPGPHGPRRLPIILTKSERDGEREMRDRERDRDRDRDGDDHEKDRSPTGSKVPTIILRTREGENRAVSPSQTRTPAVLKKESSEPPQPSYQLASKATPAQARNPLAPPPVFHSSVKLIDDSMQMCEVSPDLLLDQTDFLVVGCIGLQGVGKSTVMSLIAGCGCGYDQLKKGIFPVQEMEQLEVGSHRTSGVDLWVSPQRLMLLDTQPLLSLSIAALDTSSSGPMMPLAKRGSGTIGMTSTCTSSAAMGTDMGLLTVPEVSTEVQSLQLAAFILSVCHVVIMVQDWFFDPNILRFLQAAEMLKPPTPTMSHDDMLVEYFPHVLFVQNRAMASEFGPDQVRMMQQVYAKSFARSKLVIRSGMGVATGSVVHSLNPQRCGEPINLFILPEMPTADTQASEKDNYQGHPHFSELVKKLRRQIFGAARQPLTHTPLSEKNWLLYASKVWDSIRKNTFFHEYSRLLP